MLLYESSLPCSMRAVTDRAARGRAARGRRRRAGAGSPRSADPAPSRAPAGAVPGSARSASCCAPLQVVGDRRVVLRRCARRPWRPGASGCRWRCSPLARDFLQHSGVIGRIDQHGDVGVVLGGGAQHRRSADVDVLDRLVVAAVGPGDGGRERIEVDHQQVDRLDAVLRSSPPRRCRAGRAGRRGLRVQRLDAPVHDLREAGVVGHLAHREPGVCAAPARCRRWTGARRRAADSARAKSASPCLSDTDSSARAIGMLHLSRAIGEPHRRSFLRSVRAVDAQDLGRLALVAVGIVEHRAEQRFLDLAQHQVVQARGPVAVEIGEVVAERPLGVVAQR